MGSNARQLRTTLAPLPWATEFKFAVLSAVVLGSFVWIPVAAWYCMRFFRKHCKTWKQRLITVLAIVTACSLPSRRWRGLRHLWIWEPVVAYFQPTVHFSEPLPESSVLFCFVPHGIFPFGQALALVSSLARQFRYMRPAVADAIMRVPLVGQFMSALGCVGASKQSIEKAVLAGDSVCLVPGGIAEMFQSSRAEEALVLSRKGFVALALRHGIPLVPVYVFGNNATLRLGWGSRQMAALSRKLRVALLWAYGRGGTLVPFRVPLRYAVGKAICVPQLPHPSPEQIEAWHTVFVAAVRTLYEQHKHEYYSAGAPQLRVV